MIVSKDISFRKILGFSWYHLVWLTVCAASVAFWYDSGTIAFEIPWLPVSVIGTAVAFYVGFKNNQAYDRMWEARKIWGAIVNASRSWGMMVDGYVGNLFRQQKADEQELRQIKKKLIYRHIAWLYALRAQLLQPAPWEHINQNFMYRLTARNFQKRYGIGLVKDEVTAVELSHYLSQAELEQLQSKANPATQLINAQSKELSQLREQDYMDDFRHMELERILVDFYTQQGKCERIKKFPFPRQYANMSRYFIGIFIILLHFSMIPALRHVGTYGHYLSVPVTVLIGWIYIMMEIVADYSENPFQGMANDIPMLSLTRTIEIDLREMLGETDLPEPIKAKKDILM